MNKKNKNISDISERVKQTIDYLRVTPNQFAKILGYERSQTIYDILNGKSSPSHDFFSKFINTAYSEIISPEWLIAAQGSMIKGEEKRPTAGEPSEPYGNKGKPYPVKNGPADPPVPCAECIHKDNLIKELRRNILLLEENRELTSRLLNEKRAK